MCSSMGDFAAIYRAAKIPPTQNLQDLAPKSGHWKQTAVPVSYLSVKSQEEFL